MNSSHVTAVRSRYLPVRFLSRTTQWQILWAKLLYFVLNEVRVLCYQQSSHHCLLLGLSFKCVATQILFRRCKHIDNLSTMPQI